MNSLLRDLDNLSDPILATHSGGVFAGQAGRWGEMQCDLYLMKGDGMVQGIC